MHRIIAAAFVFISVLPAAHAGEVLNRLHNQNARINQGIRSGQLTSRETYDLGRREANINGSRRADLAANGGHLTPGEYRNLNAREDALSGQIYVDKHNAQHAGGLPPYYIR